jgi:hypothetical protein
MSEQCINPQNGRPKRCFKNRAQAAKEARRQPGASIKFYCCKHCRKYHLTSGPLDREKEFIPSAKTIRGRLENAARSIAAQQRYIEKAERVRAAQFAKAELIKKQAEQDHAETLAYIEGQVNRLRRV